MKVGGSGRASPASGTKGKKASSKSGERFSVSDETVDSVAAGNVASGSPISSIDALMALQGVDDESGGNKKALTKGQDLLEKLDAIRHGLLTGDLSARKLLQLQETLAAYKISGADPKLAEIVRDIEVRAAVELAKYGY
ncbi:flagellar assembly protein FliX [Sneathiella sp.]|uniref:flagellar assembly protein FliX n=1 Tax=Sneathiella sp. TaxID=1964365 RepID=UPI003566C1D0